MRGACHFSVMPSLSRRRFLSLTATAAGSLALRRVDAADPAAPLPPLTEGTTFFLIGDTHYLANKEKPAELDATSRAYTAGLIERLALEGLVHRAVSATDRRIQIVRLTTAGKDALDAMTPSHEAWIDSLFAGLTDDDHAQLHLLLGKLRGSIRTSLAGESPS